MPILLYLLDCLIVSHVDPDELDVQPVRASLRGRPSFVPRRFDIEEGRPRSNHARVRADVRMKPFPQAV
jgi:hypothetical protein